MPIQRINFLGYPVDSLTISEALEWMGKRIQEGGPHTITAINANKLWLMAHHPRLERFVRQSDLIIPEWAIVWGAAQLGTPLKAHVGGVMLLKAAIPWAEENGYRIFFLGAKSAVIEEMVRKLEQAHPRLQIAGWHHGYLRTQEDHDRVRAQIQASQPDMLFVAMGTPKQEYWIEDNLPALGVPIAMGVGGSFDVLAGVKEDAPDWARGNGLEWLYRLAQEPRAYWRRYLKTNPWFVWQVMKHKFRKKNG